MEGLAKPSSPVGVGARLPTSTTINDIISDLSNKNRLDAFLQGKINDVMISRPISSLPTQPVESNNILSTTKGIDQSKVQPKPVSIPSPLKTLQPTQMVQKQGLKQAIPQVKVPEQPMAIKDSRRQSFIGSVDNLFQRSKEKVNSIYTQNLKMFSQACPPLERYASNPPREHDREPGVI